MFDNNQFEKIPEIEANNKINPLGLLIIIVLGVFIGNILSYGAFVTYTNYQLKKALLIASQELKIKNEKMRERRIIQQQQNNERRKQINKQQKIAQQKTKKENTIKASLKKNCNFWTQQVNKENTDSNRNMKEIACKRYRNAIF